MKSKGYPDTVARFVRRIPATWVVLASLILVLVQQIHLWLFSIDDSYITFIYARNLAGGHGPVYNIGEHVEGYSNFLWMVLLVPSFFLRLDPLLYAKIFGILLSAATIVLTYRLSLLVAPLRSSGLMKTVSPLLLAVSAPFILWSISGLETPLYTALLVAAVYYGLREARATRSFPWSAFCCSALALTRIEGILFGCLIFAYIWLNGREPGHLVRRHDLRWLVLFFCPLIPWYVWRLMYYGWLLPNTYYAKMGGPIGLHAGIRYVAEFASSLFGGNVVAAITASILTGGWFWALARAHHRREYVLLAGVTTLHLMIVIYGGGDWMPFFRFVVPILPILFVLIQIALQSFIDISRNTLLSFPLRALGITLLAILLARSIQVGLRSYPEALQVGRTTNDWTEIGRQLGMRYPEGTTLAEVSAGAVPYYARSYLVDLFGLTDETVAHSSTIPGQSGKFASLEYIDARHPDLIMLLSYVNPGKGCCKTYIPEMDTLYDSTFFRSDYQFVKAFPFTEIGGSNAWLLLYQRVSAT